MCIKVSAGVSHLVCGGFGADGTEHLVSVHAGRAQALHPLCCLHPPPLNVLLHPPALLLRAHHRHWSDQTPDGSLSDKMAIKEGSLRGLKGFLKPFLEILQLFSLTFSKSKPFFCFRNVFFQNFFMIFFEKMLPPF